MAKLDLTKYGITGTTEIVYNPSFEQLFEGSKFSSSSAVGRMNMFLTK